MEPVDYMAETRRIYEDLGFDSYRWTHNEGPPAWTAPPADLATAKVALVASGGVYRSGQVAFHHADDCSVRVIDTGVDTDELRVTHFAYDMTDARTDINCVFPIDPLRRLAADGVIGSIAENAYTFMGGIYSARRVREELAPELTKRLLADEVDVVLLVPV